MALFGDESGLFWETEVRVNTRADRTDRPMPAIPDTGWKMPTEFPDLRGQGMIAVDTETRGLDTRDPDFRIAGVSVGTEAGYRQYFPVGHEMGPNLEPQKVYDWLKVQLARPGQPKVGAHLAFDVEVLETVGVKMTGPFYDVQIAEPLINENHLQYSLDAVATRQIGETKVTNVMKEWLIDAFGPTNYKANIWRAPAMVVGPYAEGDVDLPLRIFRKQKKELERQKLWSLFEMESKLIPMLVAMRMRGVPVNVQKAQDLLKYSREQSNDRLAQLKRLCGVDVDVWSADSLAGVYDAQKVPYPLTAKTQKPSFTKEWLTNSNHPISNLIKEARHYDKFGGTFLDGYIIKGNRNGRLHTTFNQLRSDNGGTISGRFSSSGPNLQNVPKRGAEAKLIRGMFEPEPGQVWWKFDWSQIEYRLIAHYAYIMRLPGADAVIEAYKSSEGVDYHQIIADMTGLTRDNAKNLNFGLAYGQGVDLLCANLGVSRDEGLRIIREYHMKAPFMKPLMKKVSEVTGERGYLTTLLGRVRHFDAWEKGGKVLQEWEAGARRAFLHKALNALIQGGAADLMKQAMVNCWEAGVFDPSVLGAPYLTVHDELDGSMEEHNNLHIEALREVKHIMENVTPLSVPIRADGGISANWGLAA